MHFGHFSSILEVELDDWITRQTLTNQTAVPSHFQITVIVFLFFKTFKPIEDASIPERQHNEQCVIVLIQIETRFKQDLKGLYWWRQLSCPKFKLS